jgi:hypothetical protein
MSGPVRCYLLSIALFLAACSNSSSPDAGVPDSGLQAVDSGTSSGGCAEEGQACDPVNNPCCTSTCPDGITPYVTQVCDLGSNTCLPLEELDGGNPASGCPGTTGGGTTGGGTGGGASADCALWQQQTTLAGIATLTGLAVPSPSFQIAVGTGAGQGQFLVPADAGGAQASLLDDGGLYPDAGICPPFDAGPPPTWIVLPGNVPDAGGFNGVWADAFGNVFAVGQSAASTGLLLAGNLAGNDGGIQPIPVDPSILSLTAVLGLGPAEALVGGFASNGPVLLHLLPDGGLVPEPLPALPTGVLTQIDKLAGTAAGPIYALAVDNSGPPPASWVLQRSDGGWSLLAAQPTLDGLTGPTLSNLAVGPAGDLWVVGNDGSGDGLAYTYTDGGFAQIDLYDPLGDVAPLTAVYETAAGEVFIAAVPPPLNPNYQIPQMLHYLGGAWDYEVLPAETLVISAIAGDGVGDLFAVGGQEGATVDPNLDAGTSVALILQRFVP